MRIIVCLLALLGCLSVEARGLARLLSLGDDVVKKTVAPAAGKTSKKINYGPILRAVDKEVDKEIDEHLNAVDKEIAANGFRLSLLIGKPYFYAEVWNGMTMAKKKSMFEDWQAVVSNSEESVRLKLAVLRACSDDFSCKTNRFFHALHMAARELSSMNVETVSEDEIRAFASNFVTSCELASEIDKEVGYQIAWYNYTGFRRIWEVVWEFAWDVGIFSFLGAVVLCAFLVYDAVKWFMKKFKHEKT